MNQPIMSVDDRSTFPTTSPASKRSGTASSSAMCKNQLTGCAIVAMRTSWWCSPTTRIPAGRPPLPCLTGTLSLSPTSSVTSLWWVLIPFFVFLGLVVRFFFCYFTIIVKINWSVHNQLLFFQSINFNWCINQSIIAINCNFY